MRISTDAQFPNDGSRILDAIDSLTRRPESWRATRTLCLTILWLTMTSCVANEDTHYMNALDGTWRLLSIDGSEISVSAKSELAYFTISGSTITGFDGCNDFSGRIDAPHAIESTRMACPELAFEFPLNLGELDAHLDTARIDGDLLILPARADYPESVFERDDN